MIINQYTLRDLFRGYRTAFLKEMQGADPKWPQFALKSPSKNLEEKYAWLGAVPGMKEFVGEAAIQNLAASDYTIKNREWADFIGVKQAVVETDNYGVFTPSFAALGQAAAEHPDELFGQLMVAGFSTGLDYTGTPFFAANKKAPGGKVPFTNIDPTASQLSVAGFNAAKASIIGRVNAQGRPMGLGKKLLLVVTPTDEYVAKMICKADRDALGATNVNLESADILVLPQLAIAAANGSRPWLLIDSGYVLKAFIFQTNLDPVLLELTSPTSDHVFMHHEFLYQAYGRYSVGYGLPELAYGSLGTTAVAEPLQPPGVTL